MCVCVYIDHVSVCVCFMFNAWVGGFSAIFRATLSIFYSQNPTFVAIK